MRNYTGCSLCSDRRRWIEKARHLEDATEAALIRIGAISPEAAAALREELSREHDHPPPICPVVTRTVRRGGGPVPAAWCKKPAVFGHDRCPAHAEGAEAALAGLVAFIDWVNSTHEAERERQLRALLDAAEEHGRQAEPEMEAGDLIALVTACWERLDPAGRAAVADECADILGWTPQDHQ